MSWETPAFEIIDMSAEIGAYSPDFGPDDPVDWRRRTGTSTAEVAEPVPEQQK